MRISRPFLLVALSTGLFTPTLTAQGGMTEQMREEFRRIVREEVRAALRDLRADTRAEARTDKATGRETDRATDRRRIFFDTRKTDEKKDRAVERTGVIVRGDGDGSFRWIAKPDELDEIDAFQVELDEIDNLLEDMEIQLKGHLKGLKLEALPSIETLRSVDGKVKVDTKGGIEVFGDGDKVIHLLSPKDGVEVLKKSDGDHDVFFEKDEDGVKVFDFRGLEGGDRKVEGKAKVRIWTDGKEVLDKTFDLQDAKPGAFKVWVENGKVHVDKDGDVKVFELKGDGDRKVEVKVEKAGGGAEEQKSERRLVRRRTMV